MQPFLHQDCNFHVTMYHFVTHYIALLAVPVSANALSLPATDSFLRGALKSEKRFPF